jgi:hypothetical protein
MPMIRPCATEGCGTLTMGTHCLACEQERGGRAAVDLLDALQPPSGNPQPPPLPPVRSPR